MQFLKLILASGLLIVLSQSIMAQTKKKPGCKPEACGPNDTKVAEANAIKNLRASFQQVVSGMVSSKYDFNEEIKSFSFDAQSTEEETLLVLAQASQLIREEILQKVPANKLSAELKKYKPAMAASKQELVAKLNKEIKLYNDQMAGLN